MTISSERWGYKERPGEIDATGRDTLHRTESVSRDRFKTLLDATKSPRDADVMIAQPYELHVERRDSAQNMARYYVLAIQPTLFGEVQLTRRWGRIGSRGQSLSHVFRREDDAVRLCRQPSWWGLIHSWCKLFSCNGIIRARSNSRPARPYIARLRVFNLLIWPSVCPLLQGSNTAFRTAARS